MMASAPRQRRVRSVTESLLSIVLGLEAALVFFVALTIFGLDILPPLVALGGGVLLIALLLVTAACLRFPWAEWLGWALQVGLIALGLLLPALYVSGAIFVAIWIYCFVTGRKLDRRNAAMGITPA
ncbi:MAG: DUF4233 domain-containing protein [Salinibacterium sp.]|nr:DUF4233 domain-containing protein [Salinibacterium sp.]